MALTEEYMRGLNKCLEELAGHDIEGIADIIFDAYKKGKRIFIMGNGGSATTALHFARDLEIGTAMPEKPRLQALCLAANVALITALANDID